MKYPPMVKRARFTMVGIISFFSLILCTTSAWPGEEALKAQEIISKWQDVVVPVKMVVRERMIAKGLEQNAYETKTLALATVVDPTGLAVVPLAAMAPSRPSKGEEMSDYQVKNEVLSITMRFPDNTEVPASVVIKDSDLDVAFIRPTEKPVKPLHALDLSQNTPLNILDQVIVLSRFGNVVNFASSISLSRIHTVVNRPRLLYVLSQHNSEYGIGSPVFSLNGKVAGIVMVEEGRFRSDTMDFIPGGRLRVILPAQEIVEVMKQVPSSKQ